MTKFYLGCAGWSYDGWMGPFYPEKLPRNKQLHYYSKVFNFTEINSTYYSIPSELTLKNWILQVPDTFTFSVKIWKKVTYEMNSPELESRIQAFFKRIKLLERKVGFYLIQFPPSFSCDTKNIRLLERLFEYIRTTKPICFEFRNNSWFKMENLSSFLDGKKRILVTTYLKGVKPIYLDDQRYYYIRLIGDRSIIEFNRVQRTNNEILDEISNRLKNIQANFKINESTVIVFNNHFSGFAPQDVNEFKKRLGLPIKPFKRQRKLTDFI